MQKLKRLLPLFLSILLLSGFCFSAGEALLPYRGDFGATWQRYLLEEENTVDVLILGSSVSYCNFVPSEIYARSGYTAYVMAGPEQTLAMTYFYLLEALKTQQPKAILLELSGLYFQQYTGYTRINAGYMPHGLPRLGATLFAAESGERLGLLLPLYNYHGRWAQVLKNGRPQYTADPFAGYTYLKDATPAEHSARKVTYDPAAFEANFPWLQKICALAEERKIPLQLCLAPTPARIDGEELSQIYQAVQRLPYASFVDYNDHIAAMGLADERDYFDKMHLNAAGAWKFSAEVARRLTQMELGAPNTRADSALWQERVAHFRAALKEDGLPAPEDSR